MHKNGRCVVIISVSSDIGRELALLYHRDGCMVVGTYRNPAGVAELQGKQNIYLFPCDIDNVDSVEQFAQEFERLEVCWDTFISCPATQLPLGKFFECDFGEWANSIHTNFISHLGVLHRLYERRKSPLANTVLFAGPGTNNPARYYSAVCVSKIALIKMCELLDDENEDLNVFIVGPGWVRTKTHYDTLAHPELTREHYFKTKAFMDSGNPGTPMEEIYQHIEWLISQGKPVASGRNFSTVHDVWGEEELAQELLKNPDMYKLRRYRNEWKDKVGDK